MKQFFLLFAIMAALLPLGCDLNNPDDGIQTDDIITITPAAASLLADGESRMLITANLGSLSDPGKTITFRTGFGKFIAGEEENPQTFTINASHKTAEAILQSSTTTEDQVELSAEVGEFKALTFIKFERAWPDEMILTAEKNVVDADRIDFATLTAELFRETGTPSDETKVNFVITELDSAKAEIVPFALSDENASVTAKVKSANGKPGEVQVKAFTRNQDGAEVSRTVNILFQ